MIETQDITYSYDNKTILSFPDRAETTVWKAGKYNMFFLLGVSILFFIIADWIIGIFSKDPVVINYGVDALRILCASYIFFAYQMIIGQAFNGAGDTRTPTIMNFIACWLIQIPLAYVLAITVDFKVPGVYWAIAISSAILASMSIYLFKKGKWKLKVV